MMYLLKAAKFKVTLLLLTVQMVMYYGISVLTTGSWVGPGKTPPNGGANTWSGGSFDPKTQILYIPTGNASPDFNAILVS